LDIHQLDAVNAFTNSDLDEEVYIRFPDGFGNVGFCIRLLQALYGLRRSPLLWFTDFTGTLAKLGLKPVPEAECLYINSKLIVFFYVDDIAILYRTTDTGAYDSFQTQLFEHYEMRDIGELKWFLGIRVIRDRIQRKVWLCQDSYIDKIAHTFHLTDGKAPPTPMATDELLPFDGQASPQEIYGYQRRIGSLTYATAISRPDVSRTANKLAEFLTNPSPIHQAAADRAIRYLYHQRNLALEYGSTDDTYKAFTCASDAAYSDDLATRRSTEGFLFHLFGGPIDWKSTKQRTVTTSSTEAELLALTHAAKDLYWWRRLFRNLTLHFEHDFTIQCDNQQTIRLMETGAPKLVTKLKHVDIHQHWLRQEVQENRLSIEWLPTSEMPADGLTKALPRQKHNDFIRQLRLVDISTLLSIQN
jgi:Reverse transcriptase (RNA-dependent DNA polymerase)